MAFIDSISTTADTTEDWRRFVEEQRAVELDRIIADEGLDPEATQAFIQSAFHDGSVTTSGTAIVGVLPPVSRFSADGAHGIKKQRVLDRLAAFVDRFIGLVQP